MSLVVQIWPWLVAPALLLALLLLFALREHLARRLTARRRRRLPPAAQLRLPVVLAHGFMGFDELNVVGQRHAYFRAAHELLQQLDVAHYMTKVPPTASIHTRAEQLARQVRALAEPRVIVIAHSMGGLDARYAISRLGLAQQVAALVTVATPHHGTPIAEVGLALRDQAWLKRALDLIGWDLAALDELTPAHMAQFNAEIVDEPGVAYLSVVAAMERASRRVHRLLLPSFLYLQRRAGANDGLVPASSQPWGRVLCEVEADHWGQLGWSRHFDAAKLFERLFVDLKGMGF